MVETNSLFFLFYHLSIKLGLYFNTCIDYPISHHKIVHFFDKVKIHPVGFFHPYWVLVEPIELIQESRSHTNRPDFTVALM